LQPVHPSGGIHLHQCGLRRTLNETFRKGEFDIVVVEGIRPTADVAEGKIDVQAVARRALTEEFGFGRGQPPEVWSSLLNRLVVLEFGVDLEYYQWNLLVFADTKLSFAETDGMWRKAKDRKREHRSSSGSKWSRFPDAIFHWST